MYRRAIDQQLDQIRMELGQLDRGLAPMWELNCAQDLRAHADRLCALIAERDAVEGIKRAER